MFLDSVNKKNWGDLTDISAKEEALDVADTTATLYSVRYAWVGYWPTCPAVFFFQTQIENYRDTLIMWMFDFMIEINSFRGDKMDASIKTASLLMLTSASVFKIRYFLFGFRSGE